MSGFGTIGNNLNAVNPLLSAKQNMNKQKRLCIKCQTDQHTGGGKLKMLPGFFMFICKDCLVKK
jgi:hypothetical protein